jgi:hypothetical protein
LLSLAIRVGERKEEEGRERRGGEGRGGEGREDGPCPLLDLATPLIIVNVCD